MRRSVAVIPLMCLIACSPKGHWVDNTGQGRGFAEIKADSVDCYGTVKDSEDILRKKFSSNEFDKRLDSCMADRGWKVRE
jgi:hypothetical protein